MATSKPGSSTKKSTAKKSTRSSATKVTTVKAAAAPAPKKSLFKKSDGQPNYPAIILAEVVGTMVLTLVALLAVSQISALYVGLTVAVLVLAVGVISGAHLNPAVTFGLWASRKLKLSLVPVYWVAQFVGAILALLLVGLFTGFGYPLDFGHFAEFSWGIFSIELVAAAVFLFGIVAVVSNNTLSAYGKAFGIGLSLTVAILVSGHLMSTLQNAQKDAYVESAQNAKSENDLVIPHELYVGGATVNPAIALAATEITQSQLQGSTAQKSETRYTRLSLEVILGTLIGAALGGNLYLLLAYVNRQNS